MTGAEWNFDRDNKIDSKIGILTIVGTIIFFGLVNKAFNDVIGKPKRVNADAWRWNNILVSWVHGLICGTWDILCFICYPELLDDLVFHINYFTYSMVAFSTGYFIYDFLDIMYNGKLAANWEISVHHVAVASMFYFNIHAKMVIGYNVIALMHEISSFFLHTRKLMQMLGVNYKNWLYRTVCYVNLVSVLTCRVSSCARILYGMFVTLDSHTVSLLYFYPLCVSMFVMCGINLMLFWRLFRNDVLKNWNKSTKRQTKEATAYLNENNNQPKHVKLS